MATTFGIITRPSTGTDAHTPSRHRSLGLRLAAVGLALASVALVASLTAGNLVRADGAVSDIAALGILAFGLTTAGFATVKFGIGVILLGIVRRIWLRIEGIQATIPSLAHQPLGRDDGPLGEYESAHGPALATRSAPEPLLIHRMARILWAPMLGMGAMLVAIGLVVSFLASGNVVGDPALANAQRAWMQGLQFLGEGALLAGVSFLLGTILGAIRSGGAEAQESLGLTVRTLRMPTTAKLFVALMMLGLMAEITQFVGYAVIATANDQTLYASASAWLGPLREFGLGALLAGIVLALATIGRALGFQFSRITQIITSGR